MKISSVFKFRKWLGLFLGTNIAKKLSDETYIKLEYYCYIGKRLNLKNPQTFNEKLQWLKLYDRKPEYTKMVDKYEAKKYIADIIGEEYIIKTLGVWDRFEDIDFDTLPDQFVLKTTHDSGGVVICKDKSQFDIEKASEKLNRSLKRDYYKFHREWPYKDVKPRIIAEQYMVDDTTKNGGLVDYKLLCFNGKVKCSFTVTNRFSENGINVTFYDINWEKLPFIRHYPSDKNSIKKPDLYKEMIQIAEALSKDLIFARIDFYEIKGKLYLGEITFYPGSGLEEFQPYEWDKKIGSWINLPTEK